MSDIPSRILAALEAEIVTRGGALDSIKAYSSDRYSSEIYRAAAQFWKDGIRGNFAARMNATIKFGLTDAFDLGAADMGISPDDYNSQDLAMRQEYITEEQSHVPDLLNYMDELANNPQAKLTDANVRLDLWASRFEDVRGRAKIILGKDAKLEWVYGETEHCDTCSRLNGVVKRASFWQSHGVMPQAPPNPMLQCSGWNCQCQLLPTDKPVRRGRMPRVP